MGGLYTAPHTPADSVGVTWAELKFVVQIESPGVSQSPWTPPDSTWTESGGVQ
jgi:hypothetical protein